MTLTRFVGAPDRSSLRYHGSDVLLLLAVLLLPPLVGAAVLRDAPVAAALGGSAAVAAGLGWWGRRTSAPQLRLREAFILTGAAYPVAVLLTMPAFLTVLSPVDAAFEAMSGYTTTGLTMVDESATPRSLLLLRGYTQWVGGGGIIVLSLVLLSAPGGTATHLYESEFGTDNLRGNVRRTARVVVVVYAIISAAAYAALLLAGMGAFDGLAHMLALVSTGGFSTRPGSIGAYGSPAIAAVVTTFMVVSAATMPLYYLAWRRGLSELTRDRQLRLLIALSAVGALLALGAAGWQRGEGTAGAFTVVSALTGTGFVVHDAAREPPSTFLVVLTYMVFGGATGSTTGGLKLLRVLVLAQVCRQLLVAVLLPRRTRIPLLVGTSVISDEEVRRAATLVAAYLALALLGALSLALIGVSPDAAMFESVSALSTVGLSVGVTDPGLPAWVKLVLVVQMWAGRLEFIPVLVLLHPSSWRRR